MPFETMPPPGYIRTGDSDICSVSYQKHQAGLVYIYVLCLPSPKKEE